MNDTKDKDSIQSSFMEAVEESYFNPDPDDASARVTGGRRHKTLVQVASEFDINPQKVKKILVTAKAIDTEQSRRIQQLAASGLTVKQIADEEQISESAVKSYLPYSRVIYSMDDATKGAIKQREVRKEKREKIRSTGQVVENIEEGKDVDADGYFLHNELPFKPTGEEKEAVELMGSCLGSGAALCIYGHTGCGKSRLFGYFIREVVGGRVKITSKDGAEVSPQNIFFHSITVFSLMTVNDLIPEMGRLIELELKRGMKDRARLVDELKRRKSQGLIDCYLIDDIQAYNKTNMKVLVEIMKAQQDTGIPVLMTALPPVYESIAEGQGKRYVEKDEEWDLLKSIRFYRLEGMTDDEALDWINKVEDTYNLRIELPAQWELLAINRHIEVGGMANMIDIVEKTLYYLLPDTFRAKGRTDLEKEMSDSLKDRYEKVKQKVRVSIDPDGKIRVPREFIVEMCKDKMVI